MPNVDNMEIMPNVDNMDFWNSVYHTRPEDTKYVNVRGGFTAIDAYSQVKRCTELWGPMGNQWGFRDLEYKIEGQELVMSAVFFCPEGSFPVLNNAKLKDEDSAKSCYTDSLTKALSFLGFSNDIFSGDWDKTNKYTSTKPAKKTNAPYNSPQTRQEPRTPQAVIDKGVEFNPVTGQGDQHPAQSQYETQDQGYYQQEQQYSQQPPRQQAPQGDLGVCDVCGAPNKLSQKGKTYCGALCWKGGDDGR